MAQKHSYDTKHLRYIIVYILCAIFTKNAFCFSTNVTYTPARIYIGDTVHILVKIADISQKFYTIFDRIPKTLELPSLRSIGGKDVTVSSARLVHSKDDFLLYIDCVPWKIGAISLAKFDLVDCIQKSGFIATNIGDFTMNIELLPIQISLITEENNIYDIKPYKNFVLLPGTIYILFIAIIMIVAVSLILVFLSKHIASVALFFTEIKENIRQWYIKRLTLKRLALLQKTKDLCDKDFAKNLQYIIRQYLTNRYCIDFMSVETSRIPFVFYKKLSFDLLDSDFITCSENIVQILQRTDYIRYAQGSLDSLKLPQSLYSTSFLLGEKVALFKQVIAFVSYKI